MFLLLIFTGTCVRGTDGPCHSRGFGLLKAVFSLPRLKEKWHNEPHSIGKSGCEATALARIHSLPGVPSSIALLSFSAENFLDFFLFYVYERFVYTSMPGALRGQKRASDCLELEV